MQFPQCPGFYLWYILDLEYLKVGLVQCRIEKPSKVDDMSYQYKAGYCPIKMTYQAHDNKPPCDEFGTPIVDGWIPFDMRLIDHFSVENLKFNPNDYR